MDKEGGSSQSQPAQGKKKLIIILISILVAALLLIGGAALIINTTNNGSGSPANGGAANGVNGDNNGQDSDTSSLESEANKFIPESSRNASDTDLDGLVKYIDSVGDAYANGSGYQNLTKKAIGDFYTKYMLKMVDYVNQYPDKKDAYAATIVRYAHAADDLLHTSGSAGNVYLAEHYYGNNETAEQYKKDVYQRARQNKGDNPDGQG